MLEPMKVETLKPWKAVFQTSQSRLIMLSQFQRAMQTQIDLTRLKLMECDAVNVNVVESDPNQR